MSKPDEIKPFIMKDSPSSVVALKRWLDHRTYNAWHHGFKDKRGQALIGLSWKYPVGKTFDKTGLIICLNDMAQAAALLAIQEHHATKKEEPNETVG